MAKQQNGKQWVRVIGTKMSDFQKAHEDANKSLMGNDVFIKSCEMVKIPVTKRQASKYNNKKGLAYKKGR